MSASKKKELRRNAADFDAKAQELAKKNAKNRRDNRIYLIGGVAFLLLLVFIIVWNSHVIQRSAKALTVGDETYSAAEVSYYYYNAYQNFKSQNSSIFSYLIDENQSLKAQPYAYGDDYETWHDFFLDQAVQSLKFVKATADKAHAEGFEPEEDVQSDVDSALAYIGTAASANGMSRAAYLKAIYGKLMTEKVFRKVLSEATYSSAYQTKYSESLTYSDLELEEEYAKDPKSYDHVDYTIVYAESGATASDDSAKQTELMNSAKEKAEHALEHYAEGGDLEAVAAELGARYAHYAFSSYESSDLNDWLFDDARTAGDTTTLANGTYSGYYAVVFNGRARNDYHISDVRHILVDTEEEANNILKQFNASDKSEEFFAALAADNTKDTGSAETGGLYTDVRRGDMVENFDNWLFASGRKVGDTGIVTSDYGYHVMYCAGIDEEVCWKADAASALKSSDFTEWSTDLTDSLEETVLGGMKFVG